MFILSNLLLALAQILDVALTLFLWIVIIRAIITWVSPDPRNPIVRFLSAVTDPLLYRVRRSLPVFFGGIDFSPIVVILGIYFLQIFLVGTMRDLAFQLR